MFREGIHEIGVAQCMTWKPMPVHIVVAEIKQRGQTISMIRLKLSQAGLSDTPLPAMPSAYHKASTNFTSSSNIWVPLHTQTTARNSWSFFKRDL